MAKKDRERRQPRELMMKPDQWLKVYTAAVQSTAGGIDGEDPDDIAEQVDAVACSIADNAAQSMEERFGKGGDDDDEEDDEEDDED